MARRSLEGELRQAMGHPPQRKRGKCCEVQMLKKVECQASDKGAYSVQYNYDGSLLAAGFGGGGVNLYDPRTGEMKKVLRPHRHGGYPVMGLRFHPKEPTKLLAATAEGHVYLIDTETGEGGKEAIIKEDKNEINTMDFSVDAFEFCTSGKDKCVRVYDGKTFQEKKVYKGYEENFEVEDKSLEAGNTMRVYCLKFTPENENIFLTAGWDNHIKIWDSRTNDGIKRQIHGPHICGEAIDMIGYTILTGSWTSTDALQEWDYREGKKLRNLHFPHKDGAFLYCAQYANDNTVVAGGSGTKSVEVIDRDTNTHAGSVKMTRPVMSLDTADDGQLLTVGGEDHFMQFCAMKF